MTQYREFIYNITIEYNKNRISQWMSKMDSERERERERERVKEKKTVNYII